MNHPMNNQGYQEALSIFRRTLITLQEYLEVSIELKRLQLKELKEKRISEQK